MVPDGLAAHFLPDAQEVCSYVRVSHNQVSTITRDLFYTYWCQSVTATLYRKKNEKGLQKIKGFGIGLSYSTSQK